jgi:hypothetical protein
VNIYVQGVQKSQRRGGAVSDAVERLIKSASDGGFFEQVSSRGVGDDKG